MGNIQTGRKGEDIACEFLKNQGIVILERNYKTPYGEIDILGEKDECLIFTEVKTRSSYTYGFPEEAVNIKKQEHMINSAIAYLQENSFLNREWRIDVIAINLPRTSIEPKIRWYKNAIVC